MTQVDQITAINPATLSPIGTFDVTPDEAVKDLVAQARAAQRFWAQTPFRYRTAALLRVKEKIEVDIDKAVNVITVSNGKPKVEVLTTELWGVLDAIRYFAHHSEKILRRRRIWLGTWEALLRSSYCTYRPLGVIGIISPWNFPFSIPAGQIVMALMAGNAVIHKPSSAVLPIGKLIDDLFKDVGLPKGLFATIYGPGHLGTTLIRSGVNKLLFTGSVEVGRQVMKEAADQMIPLQLELGGKDPMIVCQDADLVNAARGAVWGAFFNSGQVCASVERCYVDRRIAKEFVEHVVAITNKLRQGNGENDVDVGPMTTRSQAETVISQIEEARKRGATILTGGERAALKGWFIKPTVVTNVDHSYACVRDETFGPVLPIMTFESEDEAIRLANDSRFALTASVWTADIRRGRELSEKIEAGTVCINEHAYTHGINRTPWGGAKESGFGRSHAAVGLLELTELRHVHTNRLPKIASFWWFGYSERFYRLMKELLRTLPNGWLGLAKSLSNLLKVFSIKRY